MNPLYQQMKTSVFERMSLAAARSGAINLGQGFPDFGWPSEILEAAARALRDGSNQYAPSRGLPALRAAVADHYNRHFEQDLSSDHVCVTSGATEALAAAIFAAVEPGDEVAIFTPAYDSYAPTIRRAGAIAVEVALEPPEWRIDPDRLEAAIGPKTRAIILNNPHNPTGRLFGDEEMEAIASLARKSDLIVISDEVWEHVLLDGGRFRPLAALPGMSARTIKVGSAGKIFSLTGWKVGWAVAAPELVNLVSRSHQFLTFSTPPNLQAAAAFGLRDGDSWLEPMRANFRRARDRLAGGLREVGYAVSDPVSTYFLCVDLAESGLAMDDETFAQTAVEKAGVAVIPLSPFANRDTPHNFVRLCFAKKDETIDAGIEAMARARELLR